MARLIDADKLKPDIACHKQYTDQKYKSDRQWAIGYNAGIERALFSITYARTIEAEPVRHGKWAQDDLGRTFCTECRERLPFVEEYDTDDDCGGTYEVEIKEPNFCPQCGAKMDLEG